MRLVRVERREDMQEFWMMFGPYIHELIDDEEDLEYFLSDEYRMTVGKLMLRNTDTLRILFVREGGEIVGFITYIQYEERRRCFILEYCILPEYRREGRGRRALAMLEESVGARSDFFELTPGNADSLGFWEKQGFVKSGAVDEDGRELFRKNLNRGVKDA